MHTRSEIEATMKMMNPSKAPGIDGTHSGFYQSYWDVVGEDTVRVCLQFLNEKADIAPLNKTVIALIPKVQDPKHMCNDPTFHA